MDFREEIKEETNFVKYVESLEAFSAAVNRNSRESINTFWESVFDFVRINHHKLHSHNPRTLKFLCSFLLDKLIDHNCKDFNMILKIINTYKRWQNNKLESFVMPFDYYETYRHINYIIDPLRLDVDLSRTESFIQDIYTITESSDKKITRVLLKQGMLMPISKNIRYELRCCLKFQYYDPLTRIPGNTLKSTTSILKQFKLYVYGLFNHQQTVRKIQIQQDITGYYNMENSTIDKLEREIHRIYLMSYILKISMMRQKNDSSWEDFSECLLLYFRAVPDPFVSKDEIQEFLSLIFKNEACEEAVIQTFSDIYESLYHPDITSHFRPRSLKHLCRCSVRKILMEKSFKEKTVFPYLVSNLPVPTVMKDFILGGPECPFY